MAAEIHTPCDVGDSPLPERCMFPDHRFEHAPDERYKQRCRVLLLRPGGHLWFGAERPDEAGSWLQVGRAAPALPSAVSKVAGRIWFTPPSGGCRVLVENLSSNNILELSSPRMAQPLTLFPAARADPDDPRSELLATPMVAVQAESTTLTISNRSTDFVLWIEAPIRALPVVRSDFTANPRASLSPREQEELDHAALRIQLAGWEYRTLLRSFVESPQVQDRLRNSDSLRAHLGKKETPAANGQEPWQAFAERELRNVEEHRPTHEIHRLVLEGIGTPPKRAPRWYTQLVADHLEPDRPVHRARGGVAVGLKELIPVVKGLWAYPYHQLEEYLAGGDGIGLGRDLDDD